MKIVTRKCTAHWKDWGEHIFGHRAHAYVARSFSLKFPFIPKRAFRCPAVKQYVPAPTTDELILRELRELRRIVEKVERYG